MHPTNTLHGALPLAADSEAYADLHRLASTRQQWLKHRVCEGSQKHFTIIGKRLASTHPTIRRSGLKVTQPRRSPLQLGFWAVPASSITPSSEGADALPQQQPCDSPKYYSVKVASSVWRAHDRCARRCTQDPTFTCWALACDRSPRFARSPLRVRPPQTRSVSAQQVGFYCSGYSRKRIEADSSRFDRLTRNFVTPKRVLWLNSCKYVY